MRKHLISKTATRLFAVLSVVFGLVAGATPGFAQDLPKCLRDTPWGENVAPHRQKMAFELIEKRGDVSIVGIQFSPLSGKFAKVYGFFRHDGNCIVAGYVVGAFASANGFKTVNFLTRNEDIRYNQDFYTLSSQRRLTVTERAPLYETIKPRALRMLR